MHAVANPSQAELLHREFLAKRDTLHEARRGAILDKYGGVEHLESDANALQMASTEQCVASVASVARR